MPKKKPNSKASLCDQGVGPRREPTDSLPEAVLTWRDARQMECLEKACRQGSIPAVAEALILYHKSRAPLPLWLAQVSISMLKLLFTGKTMRTAGRTGTPVLKYKMNSIHYARYCEVKDLEERRNDVLAFIASLSQEEKDERPKFSQLAQDFTLEQRCAAVSEMLQRSNDPAKGSPDTIRYSYDQVLKWNRTGFMGGGPMPSYDNPLRFAHVNFLKSK